MDKKGLGLIKSASRNLELARRYRKEGNLDVASLLYNKAVEATLRALYLRKTGKGAPARASLGYLASRSDIPAEVVGYIESMAEPADEMEEIGRMEAEEVYPKSGGRIETTLLYLDGLSKRLLDCATV